MSVLLGRPKSSVSRLAARYIDDDLVLSDTHAWTYVRVPTVPYEFLGYQDRKSIAEKIYLALAALVTGTDPIDAHLMVTSRPFDVDAWHNQLVEKVNGQRPAPGWEQYLAEMTAHVRDQGHLTKEVYLGICLGERRSAKTGERLDLLGPVKKLIGWTERTLEMEDGVVSDAELDHFRAKAREVQRSLAQSHIAASPVHPNTVAWLITKPLYPEMDCPPPTAVSKRTWGPGEIHALAEGFIDNNHRSLAITQFDAEGGVEVTGHTATLAFSRFPDVLHFPDQEPWMHFAASLSFPVDLSSRFTLVPAQKVAKDISRKLAEAKDQATHISETGSSVPLEIQEQYDRATALEFLIKRDRQPWVYGRHRLRVTASTADELHSRVKRVIEHYRDLGIDVVWPSGDQMDLLVESMPGDKVHGRAYYQRQELSLIGGGMPTAAAEVGDRRVDGAGWVGPAIGETTSRVRTLVNFSPHVAMTRDKTGGVAVTGAPGGGKSFLAFTLAYQMAMQGVWTIYIDPKADAKPMGMLPGLGSAKVFDLREGNDGMLDPFRLGDDLPQAKLLAMETIRLLVGGTLSPEREEAMISAIEHVAEDRSAAPSLMRVVELLLADTVSTHARSLGMVLRTMKDLPFARLCFAPSAGDKIRPEDGLTVITLLGLDLPNADTAPADYSYENRLAVSVMYLLTRYARRLMLNLDKSHPKAICIDEAWAITSSPQGAKLIPEVARMGRSHNTALVLITQNASDLTTESVTNSISTVFAFRSNINSEIDAVLSLLGADAHEGHRGVVRDLLKGECLMRDVDNRIARVQIDSYNRQLFEAFDTNPETRGKHTEVE